MKRWPMHVAIRAAEDSGYDKYKHGCVLEKGGRVIAIGANAAKPAKGFFSTHAEVAAIFKAGKRARGCDLYVARVTNGKVAKSTPCFRCEKVIREFGIRRVFST